MTLALVTAALAGALSTAIAVVRLKGEQRKTAELHGITRDQAKSILALQAALDREKADRWDQVKRLEEVIAQKRRQVEDLEKDTLACSDPSAVRARLRRLLGST